jgi:hypothetical protein
VFPPVGWGEFSCGGEVGAIAGDTLMRQTDIQGAGACQARCHRPTISRCLATLGLWNALGCHLGGRKVEQGTTMTINISPDQIAKLAQNFSAQAVAAIARLIRDEVPDLVRDISDCDLENRVRLAFEAADRFGIDDDEASLQLALLVGTVGEELLTAPAIMDHLSDDTLADHERISSLVAIFEQS